MRLVILCGLFLWGGNKVPAQAQMATDSVKAIKKTEYYFYFQSGMLVGCNECGRGKEVTFSGAMVHGIKLNKRARLGLGIGYDSFYGYNTVPIFGSASWDLFAKKNAFFLQLNYGAPLKTWKYTPYDEYGYVKTSSGRMINPSVGYRIRYHDASIALMLGYKFQKIKALYEYENYVWNPTTQQYLPDPIGSTVTQELNRFIVSLSIGWK